MIKSEEVENAQYSYHKNLIDKSYLFHMKNMRKMEALLEEVSHLLTALGATIRRAGN